MSDIVVRKTDIGSIQNNSVIRGILKSMVINTYTDIRAWLGSSLHSNDARTGWAAQDKLISSDRGVVKALPADIDNRCSKVGEIIIADVGVIGGASEGNINRCTGAIKRVQTNICFIGLPTNIQKSWECR